MKRGVRNFEITRLDFSLPEELNQQTRAKAADYGETFDIFTRRAITIRRHLGRLGARDLLTIVTPSHHQDTIALPSLNRRPLSDDWPQVSVEMPHDDRKDVIRDVYKLRTDISSYAIGCLETLHKLAVLDTEPYFTVLIHDELHTLPLRPVHQSGLHVVKDVPGASNGE